MVFHSKRLVPAFAFAAIVVTASACGVMKNMDEMHDATVAMNNKMDQTNQGLSSTSNKTSELSSKMDVTNADVEKTNLYIASTYYDLRQAEAEKVRKDAADKLEHASSPEAKIAAAGVYFMAQEFQLWKGFGPDNEDGRVEKYNEAMQDFFRMIQDYKDRDRTIDPASTDARMLNLEAIAVTMHFVNPNAKLDTKTRKPISVLSLIEDTLSRRGEYETMDASQRARLPDYVKEILSNEQDAVYMLRLRANFLGAMVLANVSDIQEKGIAGTIVKLKMFIGAWEANLAGKNVVQLDTYKMWMDEANRVVSELKDLGYATRLDSKLMRIFRNMSLDASLAAGSSSRSTTALQLSAQDLGVAIDRYRAK